MSSIGSPALSSVQSGGATAANQVTGNASLTSIDSKTPALGQALAASSTPVVLTAAQITTLTPVSAVTATLAAETTKVIGVVRNADGSGNLLTSTTNALDVNLKTSSITLTVSGAVTEATLDAALIAQEATTSGVKGLTAFGAVTTAAPSYTTAKSDALSLTTGGALRGDITTIAGTAPTTVGKLDVKAADGDVFVRQTTGSNLHMVVDSGTVTTVSTVTNLAQMNGVALLMDNGASGTGAQRVSVSNNNTAIANWGQGATGAAVPTGSQYIAGLAKTALPTAASDGNLTGVLTDKFGRQIVVMNTVRDLVATQTTTLSASTTETTIVTTGAAGVFNDIVGIVISNTSASTNTRIDFRDNTAGSIIFSLQAPANQTTGFMPNVPVPQTTSANTWTAQCATSTTDIRIFVQYAKNK